MTLHPLIDRKGYTHLELIDRATGEVERIRLDDRNARASVASAAEQCGFAIGQAWCILAEGQEIATPGFVRRLVKPRDIEELL